MTDPNSIDLCELAVSIPLQSDVYIKPARCSKQCTITRRGVIIGHLGVADRTLPVVIVGSELSAFDPCLVIWRVISDKQPCLLDIGGRRLMRYKGHIHECITDYTQVYEMRVDVEDESYLLSLSSSPERLSAKLRKYEFESTSSRSQTTPE